MAQVAWEKLHTGPWADVDVAWRDLYSLACLLNSIASLISNSSSTCGAQEFAQPKSRATSRQEDICTVLQGQATHSVRQGSEGTSGVSMQAISIDSAAIMKDLDLAAIMGGPQFRSWVDAMLDVVQHQHKIHSRAGISKGEQTRQAGSSFAEYSTMRPGHKRQQLGSQSMHEAKRMRKEALNGELHKASAAQGIGDGPANSEEQPTEVSMLSWPELDVSSQQSSLPEGMPCHVYQGRRHWQADCLVAILLFLYLPYVVCDDAGQDL